MITGWVPTEESTNDCVAVCPATTFPKFIELVLAVSVATTAPSCSFVAADPPLAAAANVTVAEDVTVAMVALNVAVDEFFVIVTDEGTETEALLLDRLTIVFVVAVPLRLTVQLSDPEPVIEESLHTRLFGTMKPKCPRIRPSGF
jgi:hypothetical protein